MGRRGLLQETGVGAMTPHRQPEIRQKKSSWNPGGEDEVIQISLGIKSSQA